MGEFLPRSTPWQIDESDFYEIESREEQIRFLLRYAVLAPSSHNAQPWIFRVTDNGVEIHADASRKLPVGDPDDREMLMSIGAAIANLRVAAAHFGFETTVLYGDTTVVAIRETSNPDRNLTRHFPWITKRHTNRQPFQRTAIDETALASICDFIEANSETICFVVPHDRARVADLVAQGDRILLGREPFRNELAGWMRPNESSALDGICGDAFGIPGPLSALAPWMMRRIDVGPTTAAHDRELAENAAGLVVVTADDTTSSLLHAGEILEYFLLLVTSLDVSYSFLNQPIAADELRQEFWSMLRSVRAPQLMLRIGYAAPAARAMPRRPVDAVVAK